MASFLVVQNRRHCIILNKLLLIQTNYFKFHKKRVRKKKYSGMQKLYNSGQKKHID